MDIMANNVPVTVTDRQLRACFVGPLQECGIADFHCQRPRNKNFAFITVLDISAGQRFLSLYGVPQRAPRSARSQKPITCHGQHLSCKQSKNPPRQFELNTLEHEAAQRMAQLVVTRPQDTKRTRRFDIAGIRCGMWDYGDNAELEYASHFTLAETGTITFGDREAIVLLGQIGKNQRRMDVSYFACDNITLGDSREPTITFTMQQSPKFYEVKGEDVLEAGLLALTLGTSAARQTQIGRARTLGLNDDHRKIAGSCRVYQLRLSNGGWLPKVWSLLQSSQKMPTHFSLPTKLHFPDVTLEREFALINTYLSDTSMFGNMPYQVKYQLDRLARSGHLPVKTVIHLLPSVRDLWEEKGKDPVAYGLRKLVRHLPVPGPDTAEQYSAESLKVQLRELADMYDDCAPDNPYELVKRHQHINLIHRVVVTPTGTYLEGPEPEPTNRVLRKYVKHTDHFIRVVLADEDGGSVRYDPQASQRAVYDDRFRAFLTKPLIIAGLGFDYFGTANSALRAHSCWLMAPIADGGTLFLASMVLKDLGDFHKIRIPAKCAARIGQNFTDTNDTIELQPSSVAELPVVTRNGYDFGDGVGTISQELLTKVWRVYGMKRQLKPTALQIRFQGAKGMVSLDSRLQGEQLLLRSNMKKYETAVSWKLEICGAAFRPLPMFLNRQLIKILEDLEVPSKVFLDLQEDAMSHLRLMTESPINAGLLLRETIPQATKVSKLIWYLGEIGLDYHHDKFLYHVVEMAVVTELRDIKYRARIPVKNGMTLYGIMDETGILQEGQVFVITEQQAVSAAFGQGESVPGGKQILVQNSIVITRSPAMHPGDVQFVNAVRVPEDSPLQRLRNVVVFSQHGARDLPSQLSGGDLDGDLYNIIFDRRLRPGQVYVAADYPRLAAVELDRPVTAKDMSDFFVTFMETDQLGFMCNVHMQLADQQPRGTVSKDCLTIAAMASTAVDYSKTGIPVDMKQLPKYDKCRPDFMAPSPRIRVAESGELEIEDLDDIIDDAFEGIDEERRPMRYYRSEKILGQLYRNIDEKKFLNDMQTNHRSKFRMIEAPDRLMGKLCDYVIQQAKQYGVLYSEYEDLARNIRAGYEESLIDMLYANSPIIHVPLTEKEAFAGTILGRQGGAQGKPLRELSKTLRERFEAVADYATMRIIHGDAAMYETEYLDALYDVDEREIEAWPRSIACLVVACNEPGLRDYRLGELQSFKYIAAATCLSEFDRMRAGLGMHGPLPRCE